MLHVPIDGSLSHAEAIPKATSHLDGTVLSSHLQKGGVAIDFLKTEIRRVGAPLAEIRSAFESVESAAAHDPRAYESLTPRMRRLIDLAIVAGSRLSATDFERVDYTDNVNAVAPSPVSA